jgi:hypothetical protein
MLHAIALRAVIDDVGMGFLFRKLIEVSCLTGGFEIAFINSSGARAKLHGR